MITPVGLDLGNTRIKICIDNKCISIPSVYASDVPNVLGKTGREIKAKSFSLLFKQGNSDIRLWFGNDVLGSQDKIQKLNNSKYDPGHISILFRAALYQWSKQHRVSLDSLGKLSIVVSMPPGLYQKQALHSQALRAYRSAFNRGQSHVKIRDSKQAIQIVTQFLELEQEAVLFGQSIRKPFTTVLILDLGGETNDLAIYNGSNRPVYTKSIHSGLLHTYAKINPENPGRAELNIVKGKKANHSLLAHYNAIENIVHLVNNQLRRPVDEIYIIGGGASLMPKQVKSSFNVLAPKVHIKDEFVNARANWGKAKEILS